MTPLIEARGLAAGYGSLAAVRDLDLEVRPGEIVALLGPNGAGKTTTLRALAGYSPPLAGDVLIDGRRVRSSTHKRIRRGMAYIPEERGVFMGLSAGANLRLGRGSLHAALELFPELEPLLKRRGGWLSGGEQQILTVARALASRPKVLLADELSLGLAPMIVQRLLAACRAAADSGVGVLIVEQHVQQALSVADRVYILRHGRVAHAGTAEGLRTRLDEVERIYLSSGS